MTARPSVDFRCLTISASKGTAVMNERGHYVYDYRCKVQSDATDSHVFFHFTGSEHDYDQGKRGLAGDDLLYAFRCFVSDAEAGQQSFADFADEFGYDIDSRSAHATWLACKRSAAKWDRLWHRPVEPGDVLDELSRMGVE